MQLSTRSLRFTHKENGSMRRLKNATLAVGLVLATLGLPQICTGAEESATPPRVHAALEAAVGGSWRTPAFRERDRWRHPVQTLEFFGIRPDMTVVEVIPGGGWYTEILAPFLRDHGQLVEASFPKQSENPFIRRMAKRFEAKLAAKPEIYGKVRLTPFEAPVYMPLGPPGTADMILTFRNMHDLLFGNVHGEVTDEVMQRFFREAYLTLKPGGVLGVVAHRAKAGAPAYKTYTKGRLPQAFVVAEARRAGFELAASSEINANPKDNHEYSVWFLSPSLRKGKKEPYVSIGEADNMTLRFVKPKRP
jgi:predicted methyltransferase